MAQSRLNGTMKIILGLVGIVLTLIAAGVGYGRVSERVTTNTEEIDRIEAQIDRRLERIEDNISKILEAL